MDDTTATVIVAGINAAGFIVVAGIGLLNRRTSDRIEDKVQEVHLTMNSRLDQLVAAKEGVAMAVGHAAGVAEQKRSEQN